MMRSFWKTEEPTTERMEYERSLNAQMEDSEKMLTLIESDGWPLVRRMWQEFEDRSQQAFLSGEITPEEHAAQIKAVRVLVGGVEAVATCGQDARVKLRELEAQKPAELRRY